MSALRERNALLRHPTTLMAVVKLDRKIQLGFDEIDKHRKTLAQHRLLGLLTLQYVLNAQMLAASVQRHPAVVAQDRAAILKVHAILKKNLPGIDAMMTQLCGVPAIPAG